MGYNRLKKIGIAIAYFIIIVISMVSLTACGDTGNDNSQTPNFPPHTDTPTTPDETNPPTGSENNGERTSIIITVNGETFYASLHDTIAAKELVDLLPMTLNMSAMPHEKYYYLPYNLVTDAYAPGKIEEGDIMLWGSNCLVVFYESFSTSYSYTAIGRIENATGLATAVGSGNATISFSMAIS